MKIIDSIKKDANKTGIKIQDSEAEKLEKIFNRMFYLDKNVEQEVEFVRQVMTRGMESQERKGLHASALIVLEKQFCLRQQVLSLVYKQLQGEQLPVSTMRIFEEGNSIHEKWQRMFIRAGYAKPSMLDRTRIDKDCGVSFSPDIVCRIPDFYPGLMVGEIKSVNPFTFKKMTSHPSARKQLQFYLYLCQKAKGTLGDPDDPDYKKGFVLCEDKGTQDFKIFIYDFNIDEVKEFVKRCDEVGRCYDRLINEKKMAVRHEECVSMSCDMAAKCPMRDACWGCGMGRVRL